MEGEALLWSLDCAIDQAYAEGRARFVPTPQRERALRRMLRAMGAPFHIPPREAQLPLTMVLVMDSTTLRRLAKACRAVGIGDYVTYVGVPIKIDEAANGRVYIASLSQMTEAA